MAQWSEKHVFLELSYRTAQQHKTCFTYFQIRNSLIFKSRKKFSNKS